MNQTCEYCGTTIMDSPYWLRLSSSPGVRVFCDDCIAGPEREIKSMHAFYKGRVRQLEAENKNLVKRLGELNRQAESNIPYIPEQMTIIYQGAYYKVHLMKPDEANPYHEEKQQ